MTTSSFASAASASSIKGKGYPIELREGALRVPHDPIIPFIRAALDFAV